MHRNILLSAPLAFMAACADTPPTAPADERMYADEIAAASEGGVVRFEGTVLIFTQDPAADLRLFIGLPDDPRQLPQCGGTATFDSINYQRSGIDRDAIQVLARAEGVNVHLYRRSTYRGVCVTAPLAQGEGRLVYTDNDYFGSENPRHNSFGFSLLADVAFADGGAGTVHARNQIIIDGSGAFNTVVNFIDLDRR